MNIRAKAISVSLCCFVGVTTIAASEPTCRILVQQAATAIRHHSAATLKAWAVWGQKHPNWKPKKHPPAVASVGHAVVECSPIQVAFAPVETDFVLPSEPILFYEPDSLPPGQFTDSGLPTVGDQTGSLVGTGDGYAGGGGYGGGVGGIPPIYGGSPGSPSAPGGPTETTPPAVTPEPNYVVMCAVVLGLLWWAKRRGNRFSI